MLKKSNGVMEIIPDKYDYNVLLLLRCCNTAVMRPVVTVPPEGLGEGSAAFLNTSGAKICQ